MTCVLIGAYNNTVNKYLHAFNIPIFLIQTHIICNITVKSLQFLNPSVKAENRTVVIYIGLVPAAQGIIPKGKLRCSGGGVLCDGHGMLRNRDGFPLLVCFQPDLPVLPIGKILRGVTA